MDKIICEKILHPCILQEVRSLTGTSYWSS